MTAPNKYKPYQKVVVENFLINGERRDITGTVMRYVLNRETRKWMVEVEINSVYCLLTEDKLIDYNDWKGNK